MIVCVWVCAICRHRNKCRNNSNNKNRPQQQQEQQAHGAFAMVLYVAYCHCNGWNDLLQVFDPLLSTLSLSLSLPPLSCRAPLFMCRSTPLPPFGHSFSSFSFSFARCYYFPQLLLLFIALLLAPHSTSLRPAARSPFFSILIHASPLAFSIDAPFRAFPRFSGTRTVPGFPMCGNDFSAGWLGGNPGLLVWSLGSSAFCIRLYMLSLNFLICQHSRRDLPNPNPLQIHMNVCVLSSLAQFAHPGWFFFRLPSSCNSCQVLVRLSSLFFGLFA